MRLVVISDLKGVPVGYDLVGPKTGQERESVVELACGQPGSILFCDKGLWGRELKRTLELTDVELITPERHRLGERPPAELEKTRIRLVIESLFANLKRQMRLGDHLAKTIPGLVQRIAQRLLALTLGIFCNLLAGRAEKALVAYDGR
jgi:Transposase DDE domain